MDDTFKVEGVDYTPAGIRLLREDCIRIRDESMKQWPDAIKFTMLMTHVIVHLENYATIVEGIQLADKAVRDAGFLHMGRKHLARVDDISPEAVIDRLEHEARKDYGKLRDAAQFDENGICRWCNAQPGGVHAPDCRPPVYVEDR